MMPGIINNPPPLSHAGSTAGVSKLVDEAERPFSALQPPIGVARVRGLSKIASQPIPGPSVRPNFAWPTPVNVEAVCKPWLPENLALSIEKAVPDYGSSGSDHDPSSVSLFAMVHEFIENEGTGEQTGRISNGPGCLTTNDGDSKVNAALEIPHAIQSLAPCKDSIEEMLLKDTRQILDSIAAEARYACHDGEEATFAHSCLKRTVMSRLQKMGYIAAICKTKWDHFCGIPAGDYEYVDVLVSCGANSKLSERLLVDIDFQAQFQIARPTNEFTATWQRLPAIFVGRAERLKQIILIMSEATKQSMRVKGLHLPPWRKSGYLKSKWFSSYKRSTNNTSGRSCKPKDCHGNGLGFAVRGGGLDAKCTNTLEMLYHDTGSKLLTCGDKDADMLRRERDEITVMMTEWQPPAMAPRCTAPSRQGKVMGLTFLLSHVRAPASNETLVQAA